MHRKRGWSAMNAHDNTIPSQVVASKYVIQNTAIALEALGGRVRKLEEKLLKSITEPLCEAQASTAYQDIDLVLQTIDELRNLLDRIALQTCENDQVLIDDTINPIRLESLRRSIMAGCHASRKAPFPTEPNPMEFFD